MRDCLPAPLTQDLARFIVDLREVPHAALDVARTGVIDAIGLMLAARAEPVVQAVRAAVRCGAAGTDAGASVLFSSERMRPGDAAFVNATAAHAFAMDDVAFGCHPSAMLLPALLAEAEVQGASGEALLRAWVVGYEVLAELAAREPDSLHPTGWHPSGLLGPLATTAALCNLRGLTMDATRAALGIAASMGSGMSVNFGTPAKAVQIGRVAQSAIQAVELARHGVTASVDALERPSGFLRTISPNKRADITSPVQLSTASLRVLSEGLGIKKYPLCYSVHRLADAAIDLSRREDWRLEEAMRIDIDVGRRQADMARYGQPATSLEARYSVPFAVACGLVASAAGFAQLEPAFYESAEVRRLIAMTQLHLRDDVSTDDAVFSQTDRVRITLTDGRVIDSGEVRFARGHARLPIDAAQLRTKFTDCVASGGVRNGAALYEALMGLAGMARVDGLAALVQG